MDPRDGARMTHDATLALIRDRIAPVVSTKTVPVGDAVGLLLADDIMAPIAVPGHTNSAVDGFAFAHATYDAAAGSWFSVEARVAAGSHGDAAVDAHAAARIFTGAVMPAGLDTVVMQEDCEIEDGGRRVFVPAALKAGANVRQAGEDVEVGARILRRGQVIRAPDIAALSSLGILEWMLCHAANRHCRDG